MSAITTGTFSTSGAAVYASPMDGMVVMQTTYRGGQMNQIKVGDQPLSGPAVHARGGSGEHAGGSHHESGGKRDRSPEAACRVRFDAFPEIVVKGHVQAVGALALGGRRVNFNVRNVAVRLTLDTVDPRVIPDLSASADIATEEPAGGLIVPREAVSGSGGKSIVYVKQGEAFIAREVEIGGITNTQVADRFGYSGRRRSRTAAGPRGRRDSLGLLSGEAYYSTRGQRTRRKRREDHCGRLLNSCALCVFLSVLCVSA